MTELEVKQKVMEVHAEWATTKIGYDTKLDDLLFPIFEAYGKAKADEAIRIERLATKQIDQLVREKDTRIQELKDEILRLTRDQETNCEEYVKTLTQDADYGLNQKIEELTKEANLVKSADWRFVATYIHHAVIVEDDPNGQHGVLIRCLSSHDRKRLYDAMQKLHDETFNV